MVLSDPLPAVATRQPLRRGIAGSLAVALAAFTAALGMPFTAWADGPTTFSNMASITIADNANASPYPSSISVSGMTGVVTTVQVVLHGLSHPTLNDVDVMIVAPTGENIVLFSDVGGGSPAIASNVTLTFDDSASSSLSGGMILTGTYLPTNLSPSDTFPAPAPAPSLATTLSGAFGGISPNGTWDLFIVDDSTGDTGSIAGGWSLIVSTATPSQSFCNYDGVNIAASGPAAPYPSIITVSGLTGIVTSVTATVHGLSHSVPSDIDLLLSGPTSATNLLLMSDAGGTAPASNLTMVFADSAVGTVPSPLASGTFRPTNDDSSGVDVAFPAPAPVISSATTLAVFNGSSGNGVWNLWVVDDAPGDSGSISGGWCLSFTTAVVPSGDSAAGDDVLPTTGTPATNGMTLLAGSLLAIGVVFVLAVRRGRFSRQG